MPASLEMLGYVFNAYRARYRDWRVNKPGRTTGRDSKSTDKLSLNSVLTNLSTSINLDFFFAPKSRHRVKISVIRVTLGLTLSFIAVFNTTSKKRAQSTELVEYVQKHTSKFPDPQATQT